MDFFKQIEEIKRTLKDHEYNDLVEDLTDMQLAGGTGGEVLIAVCSRLLGMKEKHPLAFSYVKGKAQELIKYANSIGLYPKPTYKSNG